MKTKMKIALQKKEKNKPAEPANDMFAPSLTIGVTGKADQDYPAQNPINENKLVAPTPQDLPRNYKMKDKMPPPNRGKRFSSRKLEN